ncbi:MAG: SUF system Fe-S cluster assembly regulator [Pseudomonadota bacterium]
MIRLSKLADYAVVVMAAMGRDHEKTYSATDLARETGVPAPTVAKLLGALARADLLSSRRGVGGGFQLARATNEISVADMIEAIDGPIAVTACIDHAPGDCSLETICGMRPHWQMINAAISDALKQISLADLASKTLAAFWDGVAASSESEWQMERQEQAT